MFSVRIARQVFVEVIGTMSQSTLGLSECRGVVSWLKDQG